MGVEWLAMEGNFFRRFFMKSNSCKAKVKSTKTKVLKNIGKKKMVKEKENIMKKKKVTSFSKAKKGSYSSKKVVSLRKEEKLYRPTKAQLKAAGVFATKVEDYLREHLGGEACCEVLQYPNKNSTSSRSNTDLFEPHVVIMYTVEFDSFSIKLAVGCFDDADVLPIGELVQQSIKEALESACEEIGYYSHTIRDAFLNDEAS
jgi:hypothetical protein